MEKTAESLDWIMKALVKEQMGTGQAPAVFKTKEQRQKEGNARNNPPHGKTNNVGSDQVQHNSGCTETEKS